MRKGNASAGIVPLYPGTLLSAGFSICRYGISSECGLISQQLAQMVAVCPAYAQGGSIPQRHAAVAVGQRGDACNSIDAHDGSAMDPYKRAGVEPAAKYVQ